MHREELSSLLEIHYGIIPEDIQELNAYATSNFLVTSPKEHFVVKFHQKNERIISNISSENDVLLYLNNLGHPVPLPVFTKAGYGWYSSDKGDSVIRVLKFIPGRMLGECELNSKIIDKLGIALAMLNKDLTSVTNVAIEARKILWDLEHFHALDSKLNFITRSGEQKIVAYYLQQWKLFVLPQLPDLRQSMIHNDINDWNIVLDEDDIQGIIDFGDMVYSRLIFEAAIACTYLAMKSKTPVETIGRFLKSYHEIFPLEEKEIDLFYYLIAGRLCTSVIFSAIARKENPDNAYLTISEKGAWHLLHQWVRISPKRATNAWRKVLDLPEVDVTRSVKEKRISIFPKVLSLSYDDPIHMDRGAFQYLYDESGNTYLDAYNNIIQVGHCHPAVVDASMKSTARLNTNTRYLYSALTDYGEKLLDKFPHSLNKILFVNSGSAAADLAIRMARAHTGKENMLVMEHGYHGNTQVCIEASHYKFSGPGGNGKADHISVAQIPNVFRGPYRDSAAGEKYADDLIASLQDTPIGAFIAEPIIGCGGQVPLPPGYLKKIYGFIKSQGGVCISDEVQVGFGRLGKWYWGFEMHEVIPDLVILGKPMGNGHPLAAVVTSEEIASSFENGMEFFSSFGGNPVSCSIGLAVLETIEKESLQQNALMTGSYLKKSLVSLQSKYPAIGDVRGEGLFLGVEIIRADNGPDGPLAKTIINEMRNQFILISLDGPGKNVLKIKPPLCFNCDNTDQLISGLENILKRKI